jgi:prepilin peptidase CpaA
MAYAMGILGAGDVKLVAAVGAWLGLGATIGVVLVAALAAIIYSFVSQLFWGVTWTGGGWKRIGQNITLWVYRIRVVCRHFVPDERIETAVAQRESHCHHLVPFAAMVAIGCVVVFVGKLLQLP